MNQSDYDNAGDMMSWGDLLNHLENESGVFGNPRIKHAFETVDRKTFVDEDYKVEAYEDYALPTLHGQTISQPTTVAFMLELLDVKKGDKVLDIGAGSGWTTALLSDMAGGEGSVFGVERIAELTDVANEHLNEAGFSATKVETVRSGEMGLGKHAPYDRILVNAAADELPLGLLDQLKVGGVLVIPIGQSIYRIVKKSKDTFEDREYPGFTFVPLAV